MSQSIYPLLQALALAAAGFVGSMQAHAQDAASQGSPVESHETPLARARVLATSGDPAQREQAIGMYSTMLETSPENSDVLLARGRTYAWMSRYAEAEADLLAVTGKSPAYADAWSALGDMYLWSERPELAVAAYTHWLELAPDDPAAALARGRAHRAAGNAEAARADFAAARVRGAADEDVRRLQASTVPQFAMPDAIISDAYRWSLRAGIANSAFNGSRADWNDADFSLRRKFERGSLALEWIGADRFGRSNSAWALDGYASLWSRAYANMRYQRGPSDGILPRDAWRVEVFQGVGRGWELSASIDHLRFDSDTEFYGVGVGRYVGNWYMRYKLQHVPGAGSGSWSHRAVVRNYYRGDADSYLEFNASNGRSADLDRGGGVVRNSNAALGIAWSHYFHPQWGFKLGAGYSDDADGFDERRLSFALYHRW